MNSRNARRGCSSTEPAPGQSPNARALLQWAARALADAGVDSPRLNAELLLAYVLKCDRLRLITEADANPSAARIEEFRALIQRRASREPLQHLIGWTEFWSLPIRCDRRALVPRPETELLVELGLELVRSIANPLIADIGTGTGCIGIAMAVERPDARLIATDVSPDALALALENIQYHHLEARIELRQGDLTAPLAAEGAGAYDLILSNPPYIPDRDIPGLQPEVRDYDPALALRGGPEGCTIISRLLRETRTALKAGGHLAMEIGEGEAEAVRQDAARAGGWRAPRTVRDSAGIERIIVVQKE